MKKMMGLKRFSLSDDDDNFLSYRNSINLNSDNEFTFSVSWTGFSGIVKNTLNNKKDKNSFNSNLNIKDQLEKNVQEKKNSYLKSLENDSIHVQKSFFLLIKIIFLLMITIR